MKTRPIQLQESELYSYADVAKALPELSGKTITYSDIDSKTFEDSLKKVGVPEYLIVILSGFISDKSNGQYEILSDDLENILGRKPVSLKVSLKEIYTL